MEVGDVYRCTLCRRIAQASLGSPMSELSRFSVELLRSYVILYFQCDRLSRRLFSKFATKIVIFGELWAMSVAVSAESVETQLVTER